MKSIVTVCNASVSFQKKIILNNISLTILENSFISIIGPNGAGKTTLLNIINGLKTIKSGSIEVFGESATGWNWGSIRKEIGYVPQYLNSDPKFPLSVKEVVSIGRVGKVGLFRKMTSQDERIVHESMGIVGIDHLAEKPIGHLSGGERQKVSLARALAQEPRMILCDEPTSNLDPKSQNEIIALIENVHRKKRMTVVFVTHSLSHIPESCTEVVLIKNGRIIDSGPTKEVLQETNLSELYDYPVRISKIDGRTHFHTGNIHP